MWANLPEPLRAEIHKREQDMFSGIAQYKEAAAVGQTVYKLIEPYREAFTRYQVNPVQHIGSLLETHHRLVMAEPAQRLVMLQAIARDLGVDLTAGAAAPLDPPYVDPAVEGLQKELAGVKSVLTSLQTGTVEAARAKIAAEIAAFANDKANIYFDELQEDIALLIKTDKSLTLKDAYEKAIWLNPAVRAKELQRQNDAKATEAKKAADEAVAAARRRTGANLRTSERTGRTAAPVGSMDDTMKETLAKITARGS